MKANPSNAKQKTILRTKYGHGNGALYQTCHVLSRCAQNRPIYLCQVLYILNSLDWLSQIKATPHPGNHVVGVNFPCFSQVRLKRGSLGDWRPENQVKANYLHMNMYRLLWILEYMMRCKVVYEQLKKRPKGN